MNINLREVICTSRDGDRFWRMAEVYIRGSTIKYLRIPDEVSKFFVLLWKHSELAGFCIVSGDRNGKGRCVCQRRRSRRWPQQR